MCQNQLKNAIIKAIDVLTGSDPTDRSNAILQVTKPTLQNDIQASIAPQQIRLGESGITVPSQTDIQQMPHHRVTLKSLA